MKHRLLGILWAVLRLHLTTSYVVLILVLGIVVPAGRDQADPQLLLLLLLAPLFTAALLVITAINLATGHILPLSHEWPFIAAYPPVLVVVWAIGYRKARAAKQHQHRIDAGLCLRCGYDLRASKERCPECGTPVPAGTVRKPVA